MDDHSFSGQHSGWHDYPASIWAERKPTTWLHDWAFWQDCAKTYAGDLPVLELACGNGRITHQLVQAGFAVMAVDINPHFLNHALETIPKTQRHRVGFFLQDVVQLDIPGQFHLAIMADWAFPALLTQHDQIQFLQRLAQHLTPEGIFAFNTPLATSRQVGMRPNEEGGWHWPGTPRWYDALTQVETDARGPHPVRFRHSTLDELHLLARLTGFTIKSAFGGADHRPLRGIVGDDLTLILQKNQK
jgi:SAM-dependent methyltransferase